MEGKSGETGLEAPTAGEGARSVGSCNFLENGQFSLEDPQRSNDQVPDVHQLLSLRKLAFALYQSPWVVGEQGFPNLSEHQVT